ncbi:MAG: hypothetical protein ACREO9_05335, partial [Lysobacterales bacterium]
GRAVELLEQAVVLDAGFARGWAMLAAARGILGYYDIDIGLEHTLAITIDAAERALALDPQAGEAYAVRGLTAIHQGRYQTAVALLARSIKLTPSFAQAYSWQAGALRNVGQWEEAERVNHQALELDPYSYFSIAYLAFHFLAEGRTGEASELLQAKLAMDTNLSITHIELGNLALAQGDWAAAYAHYAHVVGDDQAALALLGEVFSALDGRGSKAEVAQLVTQQMYDALSPSAMSIRAFEAVVMTLIALGEMDAALSYIEQIAAMPAGKLRWRLAGFSLSSINVGQLRCEPRFQAVMTANGLVDGLAERICAKDPGESLPVQP